MAYRYLVDTNLLIYPLDARDPEKQGRAAALLLELVRQGGAVLPVQALSEFSSVALRRLQPPLPPEKVVSEVEQLITAFPVLPLTSAIVLEALRGSREHRFGYYDAQVWATARLHQIPLVLSEDFPGGAIVEGVRFVNPFTTAF